MFKMLLLLSMMGRICCTSDKSVFPRHVLSDQLMLSMADC